MHVVSSLACRHAPRICALLALVAIAWLGLVLLASVAGAFGEIDLLRPDRGLHLAPFRWEDVPLFVA